MVASPAPPTGDLARNPGCAPMGIQPATFWFAGLRSTLHQLGLINFVYYIF